jgi:hypothetical protein
VCECCLCFGFFCFCEVCVEKKKRKEKKETNLSNFSPRGPAHLPPFPVFSSRPISLPSLLFFPPRPTKFAGPPAPYTPPSLSPLADRWGPPVGSSFNLQPLLSPPWPTTHRRLPGIPSSSPPSTDHGIECLVAHSCRRAPFPSGAAAPKAPPSFNGRPPHHRAPPPLVPPQLLPSAL